MNNSNNTIDYNKLISFIWSVADECLRDIYTRGKYRDVIVPMTLIARFDAVLAPQKENIIKEYKEYKSSCEKDNEKFNEELFLKNVKSQFGLSFYNTYDISLADVIKTTDAKNLKEEFSNYINSFSPNVIDILNNFQFNVQIDKMHHNNILGSVIRKFTSSDLNLSPYDSGSNKGLDNHAMGTLFEEIIRKFNEENNEEAGEHFTPRDVVELIADLAISPVLDQIKPSTYRIYDGACGTFGMGSVAEERLKQYTKQLGFDIKVNLYGQEINGETYAISKADLLIKGENNNQVYHGSTLSKDGFADSKFDFMLSNPPYGKDWKTDLEKLSNTKSADQKAKIAVTDPRFVIDNYDEAGELRMLPDIGDGQLLFLLNNISKMKTTGFGSRIVEVHNGSALFGGDAGTGANNIRRYIIENDLLEAVIQLPVSMFYNTAITTHLWVLANKKADHRKGKVQLIDASSFTTPLLKSLGSKRYVLSAEDREYILELYNKFEDDEYSKILNNEDLGYYKVAIETPLRQSVACTTENIDKIEAEFKKLGVFNEENTLNKDTLKDSFIKNSKTSLSFLGNIDNVNACLNALKSLAKDESYLDSSKFIKEFDSIIKQQSSAKVKWSNFIATGVDSILLVKDKNASVVKDNKKQVVYDNEAKDYELVPLNYEGIADKLLCINKYLEKEVLPFNPEACLNEKSILIGYDINFSKYFYKPIQLKDIKTLTEEIQKLEKESTDLLKNILEGIYE